MNANRVDLSAFHIGNYDCGAKPLTRVLWYFVGLPILRSSLMPLSSVRRALLRAFGARVGTGVTIRPGVRVKNPWLLTVGDHCMIGEDAWIDNLSPVTLEDHVCISQAAYLCTGNHDWSSPTFQYRLAPIHVGRGAWVGARSLVGPGTTLAEHSVLAAGSVLTRDTEPFGIYAGNPAVRVRTRRIHAEPEASVERRKPAMRW